MRGRHGVRKKRKLRARSVRHVERVDLGNVGKARADQHLPPRGMPVIDRSSAKLAITLSPLGNRNRNRRNVLQNEIVIRADEPGLSGRALSQSRDTSQQQSKNNESTPHQWASKERRR